MTAGQAGKGRDHILANIQVLRALAATMVIFVHLETPLTHLGMKSVSNFPFGAGVDLFFVISGFIMVHTTNGRTLSPYDFMRLRIIRIVPLYWLVTLFVFAIAVLWPFLMSSTDRQPLALIKSLLFIPFVRPDGLVRPVLFLGWTLNLEMMFYTIFALTLFLKNSVIRVLIGISILAMMVIAGQRLGASQPVLDFVTSPILLEFALGMAIGLLFPHLPTKRPWGLASAGAAIVFASLIAMAGWTSVALLPAAAVPAGLTVFVALALEKSGMWLGWNPALLLGNASYALYLTHPLVTESTTRTVPRLLGTTPLSGAISILVALSAAIALAIVVHLWIERPLGKWVASRWT